MGLDCQVPLSMEFSRQGYWSGLKFSTPGYLPNPGIELTSPESPALVGGFSTTEPQFAKSFSAPITYLDYYIFLKHNEVKHTPSKLTNQNKERVEVNWFRHIQAYPDSLSCINT